MNITRPLQLKNIFLSYKLSYFWVKCRALVVDGELGETGLKKKGNEKKEKEKNFSFCFSLCFETKTCRGGGGGGTVHACQKKHSAAGI